MRQLLLCALLVATSARSELLASPGRLWLTGGAAYRSHQQRNATGAVTVSVGGTAQSVSPWDFHFSGAFFFNRLLGVDLEARGELFYATQTGTPKVPQSSFELTPAATARWLPTPWLSLEGQLGWGLQLRSGILTGGPVPLQLPTFFTGPSFGVAVGLAPSRFFSGQLFFRAQPVGLSLSGVPGFGARVFSGGAQLSVGALRLGGVQVGAAVTAELSSARLFSTEGRGDQFGARVGVGLSLMRAPEEVVPVVVPVVATKVTVSGRTLSGEGAALAGVVVSLDGESPVPSDETGAFSFPEVTPGPHVLRARKAGFKSALQEVSVTATPVPLTVTLLAPTGPGRISGVVRSKEAVVAGASVSVGAQVAVSDAEGRFALEGVGPGPVKVTVKATGFSDAEEVAQVPAEAEANLDFMLVPMSAEVRATLRGLIRAKSGEALNATVRVVELKLKLSVKADGRFSADVPSGHYTLVIEARGYLSQTKTVEVSGGDQAIFHAELEKTR